MFVFSWVDIAKYYRPGGLNNRNLASHGAGSQKSKIKALAGFVSSSVSPLDL